MLEVEKMNVQEEREFQQMLKGATDDDLILLYLASDMLPDDGSIEMLWTELECRKLKLPSA